MTSYEISNEKTKQKTLSIRINGDKTYSNDGNVIYDKPSLRKRLIWRCIFGVGDSAQKWSNKISCPWQFTFHVEKNRCNVIQSILEISNNAINITHAGVRGNKS